MTDLTITDDPHDAPVPSGFERTASGLVVPAEHAREREVFSGDEARILARAIKVAAARGLRLIIGCDDPQCADIDALQAVIQQFDNPDGGRTWRCAHKDRIIPGPPVMSPTALRRQRRAHRR